MGVGAVGRLLPINTMVMWAIASPIRTNLLFSFLNHRLQTKLTDSSIKFCGRCIVRKTSLTNLEHILVVLGFKRNQEGENPLRTTSLQILKGKITDLSILSSANRERAA